MSQRRHHFLPRQQQKPGSSSLFLYFYPSINHPLHRVLQVKSDHDAVFTKALPWFSTVDETVPNSLVPTKCLWKSSPFLLFLSRLLPPPTMTYIQSRQPSGYSSDVPLLFVPPCFARNCFPFRMLLLYFLTWKICLSKADSNIPPIWSLQISAYQICGSKWTFLPIFIQHFLTA